MSIAEEFKSVDAVFLGKVTHVGVEYKPIITSWLNEIHNKLFPPPPYYYTDMFSGERVTFAVKSSWKSVSTTEITLRSHDDCGYGYTPFFSGTDYLIYAYRHDSNPKSDLYVGFCTRTVEISNAVDDLSYLNTLPTLPLTPVQNVEKKKDMNNLSLGTSGNLQGLFSPTQTTSPTFSPVFCIIFISFCALLLMSLRGTK